MRKAEVYQQAVLAGTLDELGGDRWRFTYAEGYSGEPVSLTMPANQAQLLRDHRTRDLQTGNRQPRGQTQHRADDDFLKHHHDQRAERR